MARASEPPVVLVQWYELTKWLLARIESFPKSQRFVFGQRLADRTLGVMETLVEAAYTPAGRPKAGLLARANRELEVLRWRGWMEVDILSAGKLAGGTVDILTSRCFHGLHAAPGVPRAGALAAE